MKILVVRSGSKGNATLVEHEGCVLLIDMGTSLTAVRDALASINKNLMNINALLLTHSHSDHTSGVRYLDPLPIYCSEGTYKSKIHEINLVKPFDEFKIGPFKITPVEASHDAPNSLGYLIQTSDEKLAYITDTGFICEHTLELFKNCDYFVFESNHDRKMLLKTHRPPLLKARIMSDTGHLDNVDSAYYMCSLIGDRTKEIILAHLSEEANTPEKALETYARIFRKQKIHRPDIYIHCANQHEMVEGGKR